MHEALDEWALGIGVDVSKPEAKLELQADFRHLRRWRKIVEGGGLKAAYTVITIVVTAAIGALWIGIQTMLGRA